MIAFMGNENRNSRWLTLLIAFMTLVQAGGLIRTMQRSEALSTQLTLSRPLEIAAGLVWLTVFGWLLWALIRNRPHAQFRAVIGVIGFIAYSVLRLFIFAQADYDRQRIPFLVLLLVITALLASGFRLLSVFLKHKEIITYDSKPRNRRQDPH